MSSYFDVARRDLEKGSPVNYPTGENTFLAMDNVSRQRNPDRGRMKIIKSPVQIGQRWRHVKRGSTYDVLAIATGQGGDIEDQDVVVYIRVDGSMMVAGQTWARRLDEFTDGRFTLVSEDPYSAKDINEDTD